MSIVMCPRCDETIDLDINIQESVTIDDEEVCWSCLTDKEQEAHEN